MQSMRYKCIHVTFSYAWNSIIDTSIYEHVIDKRIIVRPLFDFIEMHLSLLASPRTFKSLPEYFQSAFRQKPRLALYAWNEDYVSWKPQQVHSPARCYKHFLATAVGDVARVRIFVPFRFHLRIDTSPRDPSSMWPCLVVKLLYLSCCIQPWTSSAIPIEENLCNDYVRVRNQRVD